MNPKQIVMIGAIAVVISIGSVFQSEEAHAGSLLRTPDQAESIRPCETDASAALHEALGVSTDEQIYDALYEGRSLADIAAANGKDARHVIDLQVSELSEQLDRRLASGSLSWDRYLAHKAELTDMITRSVYGTDAKAHL
ncbi:hypothetical protein [Paenibacillus flagellatus]|uniref:Uncharacterized protein n=1 Tax=Paenibacillus flagellatus TaxID=2211139 RepID=A0A2V5JXG3_9BACL|nr:hypothetical protein [Paenibacillus flagellatus]PYI51371.1 hypothetical protein DLM86_25435 [Paenibacillus flagellatus]